MSPHTVNICHVVVIVIFASLHPHCSEASSCSQLCHYVPWARDADCSRRHLQKIPLECVDSKVLNLNKNNITEVPSRVFSTFGHLKYLQMLENHVHEISANSFAGAQNLKCVNLLKNSLVTIPAHSFNDTISLRWVYLSRNKITTIEEGVFQESPLIEMLYMDDNQLDHLDAGVFSGLSMMQRLLLGHNRLRSLPDGVFTDMTSLDYIDLSGNYLQTLSVGTFSGLINLQTIKLSGNGLVEIMAGTFSNNPVSSLDISDNNLMSLPWDESDFTELQEIEAAGNRWVCDCALDPFRVALIDLSLHSDSTVVCADPASKAHTDITSHSSFCSLSTTIKPPSMVWGIYMETLADPTKGAMKSDSGNSPTNGLLESDSGNSPEMITLIVVATVTCVALIGMGVFLLVTLVIPRMRRGTKYQGDVKTTYRDITIKGSEMIHPEKV